MTSAHLINSPDPTARGSYLNSNDAESPEDGKVMKKMCRIRFLSNDPRSPSAGIIRTPIEVRIGLFTSLCLLQFTITRHIFIFYFCHNLVPN